MKILLIVIGAAVLVVIGVTFFMRSNPYKVNEPTVTNNPATTTVVVEEGVTPPDLDRVAGEDLNPIQTVLGLSLIHI